MDCLLPETRDLLLLTQTIARKQDEWDEIGRNRTTRQPAEAGALFRREQVEQMITAGRVLTNAANHIAEKDDELKILFCEANEHCDKAKDGKVRLCRVNKDGSDRLVEPLTAGIPADDHDVEQAVKECDRLSGLMEKRSIQGTRTASELKNILRRLDQDN